MQIRSQPRASLDLAVATALMHPPALQAAEAAVDDPNRPIRYVLPNAPGSNADIFTRIIAKRTAD